MGLLNLLNKKRKAPAANARPWTYPIRGAVDVGGDCEYRVYTYDSRPLGNIRKGQVIDAEVFCGECTMESIHTGTVWNTAEDGDLALLKDGVFFGFADLPREKVIEAARLGYALRFKAVCTGMVDGYDGVVGMRLLAPRPLYLYGWVPGAQDDRPE